MQQLGEIHKNVAAASGLEICLGKGELGFSIVFFPQPCVFSDGSSKCYFARTLKPTNAFCLAIPCRALPCLACPRPAVLFAGPESNKHRTVVQPLSRHTNQNNIYTSRMFNTSKTRPTPFFHRPLLLHCCTITAGERQGCLRRVIAKLPHKGGSGKSRRIVIIQCYIWMVRMIACVPMSACMCRTAVCKNRTGQEHRRRLSWWVR